MKNAAMGCLILIIAGCTVAPTSGVSSNPPKPSPTIIPTAQALPADAPALQVATTEKEGADEMVGVADPVKKIKKGSPKIDMKERVALANQIMKDESAGSNAPVVCDTTARRTPAGQLIYESSCH